MQEQTTGATALQPTGNAQGEYFFMRLTTGQRLSRHNFTLLPIPQDVIISIHRLARRNPRGLNIRDRDRRPFLQPNDRANDDDDYSTYDPSDDNNRDNENESDDSESDNNDNTNLHLPPEQ